MISNWAKCIKLKLVILDWVSKQFSDTSFAVGSADRWSMLSFLLEENNYQEDKAVLFWHQKEVWHIHIQYSLSQPETQVSCTILHAVSGQWALRVLHFGDDRACQGDPMSALVVSSNEYALLFHSCWWLPCVSQQGVIKGVEAL